MQGCQPVDFRKWIHKQTWTPKHITRAFNYLSNPPHCLFEYVANLRRFSGICAIFTFSHFQFSVFSFHIYYQREKRERK